MEPATRAAGLLRRLVDQVPQPLQPLIETEKETTLNRLKDLASSLCQHHTVKNKR